MTAGSCLAACIDVMFVPRHCQSAVLSEIIAGLRFAIIVENLSNVLQLFSQIDEVVSGLAFPIFINARAKSAAAIQVGAKCTANAALPLVY
ncbi:hypothetical protein HBI83_258090 [Parastagonospora nodorum]|nr:hypothetical protein HBI83_258090 [Parastagonospora nodorum]